MNPRTLSSPARRASHDREDATRRQNDRDRRQKPTERAREQKQTEKKIDADFQLEKPLPESGWRQLGDPSARAIYKFSSSSSQSAFEPYNLFAYAAYN